MNKKLHIVCLDVPYPADHGGMFDLFYKIVALHTSGTEIILHCFEYGKGEQEELNKYCSQIYYYKRRTGSKGFSFLLPYIVSSRINEQLIKNLQKDNFPILLEGTHTTYLAYKEIFPARTILFRLHNIEHVYYYNLFRSETKFLKKIYYGLESKLLKKYESKTLMQVSYVLPVSKKDAIKLSQQSLRGKVIYLPVFLPFQEVKISKGFGNYCMYHGNLSVAENIKAAFWIAEKIDTAKIPLMIAGKNPPGSLKKFLKSRNVRLIANPSNEEMFHLIQNAHINVILSYNDTGIKLKLLNALFHGRHCIANEPAIPDEDFKTNCTVFSSQQQLNKIITSLIDKPFTEDQIKDREKFLITHFNNQMSAAKLNALL